MSASPASFVEPLHRTPPVVVEVVGGYWTRGGSGCEVVVDAFGDVSSDCRCGNSCWHGCWSWKEMVWISQKSTTWSCDLLSPPSTNHMIMWLQNPNHWHFFNMTATISTPQQSLDTSRNASTTTLRPTAPHRLNDNGWGLTEGSTFGAGDVWSPAPTVTVCFHFSFFFLLNFSFFY